MSEEVTIVVEVLNKTTIRIYVNECFVTYGTNSIGQFRTVSVASYMEDAMKISLVNAIHDCNGWGIMRDILKKEYPNGG